jgi:hypothetical protein
MISPWLTKPAFEILDRGKAYDKNFKHSLISVGKLKEKGYDICFKKL